MCDVDPTGCLKADFLLHVGGWWAAGGRGRVGVGVYQEPAQALWIQTCRCVTAGLALDKLKLPCSHIRVRALRMNRTVQMVPS